MENTGITTNQIENEEAVPTEESDKIVTDVATLADNIMSTDSIQEYLPLFNASIAKKQALRVLKREEIIDKVTERIGERLDKRPDEITMTELNAIDKTMSEQKQKELALLNSNATDASVGITLNQNNVNVTINNAEPPRESRERVLSAVRELLKMANTNVNNQDDNADADADQGQ